MKYLLIILVLLTSCASNKRVFICGDHECINKEEAKLFFEQNLSIEVKIIKKEKEDHFNLVKLNTQNPNEKQNIKIVKHKQNKEIKKLSKSEINEKRREIKNIKKLNKKNKNLAKKSVSKNREVSKNLENDKKISKKNKKYNN